MAVGPSSVLPRPFGPYELVRKLARGADSELFLARARSVAGFEKAVALKMIHPSAGEDPEFARLLIEEANIASQLSHKNVVQVIDLGQIDGLHYIAMEYVDGLDLGRLSVRMASVHAWPPSARVAAYVMREVCEGLEHAHRKTGSDGKPLRIVHRDVAPSNILVSFSGEVKLTDFGFARASMRAATRTGNARGRFSYMAPEQVRGQAVDARADVFSAGAVLYEMVTGQPVYPAGPPAELIERASSGRFPPPESIRADIPPPVLDILRRSLAADPARRYPTARAMGEDLASYLYTVPPNPELDLVRVLESSTDNSRNVLQPLGALLVDDASDDVTQIESSAAIRARILATKPSWRDPSPDPPPDPRPTLPVARMEDASAARPSGGVARVRGRLGRPAVGIATVARSAPSPPLLLPSDAPTNPPAPRVGADGWDDHPTVETHTIREGPFANVPPAFTAEPHGVATAPFRRPTAPEPPVSAAPVVITVRPPLPPSSVVRAPTLPSLGGTALPPPPFAIPAPRSVVRAATLPPVGMAPPAPAAILTTVPMAPPSQMIALPAQPLPAPVHDDGGSGATWKLVAAGLLALVSVGVLMAVVLLNR